MTGSSTDARAVRPTARQVLFLLTFVVSFCSFAYEFVYSELLTVMYGGTVTQYTITIGLYFFSLGIGSALSDDLSADRAGNFFRTEVALLTVAPVGFLLVVLLNSVPLPGLVPAAVYAVVARLPVVAVGFLSGFELPLLTAMVETEAAEDDGDGGALERVGDRLLGGLRWLVGALFHVERTEGQRSGLSLVLALDYVGGLAGAVVYALYLYPTLGLVPTVFVLALLNGVAALTFAAAFGDWRWRLPGARVGFGQERRALLAVCLLLTAGYAGVAVNADTVDERVSEFYLEGQIEAEFAQGAMAVDVTSAETTAYQRVVRYDRTWQGTGPNPYFDGETESCLRLGEAVQLCESWARSYHEGLVDVPMSLYENSMQTNVLVLGGGDFIAVDRLRDHNVSVDLVDLDRGFQRRAMRDEFYTQWNDRAWEYEHLNRTVADGFAYVRNSDERYDLILLDLPGATDSDLLRLYSTEFYEALRGSLTDDGVVGTWAYSPYGHAQHHAAYTNTVAEAGFTQRVTYHAWDDLDGDGSDERVERFYLLSPDEGPAFDVDRGSAAVREHRDRYRDLEWSRIATYDGVRPNSIFHPNYDIIIDDDQFTMTHTDLTLTHRQTRPSLSDLDVKRAVETTFLDEPLTVTVIGSSHYVGSDALGFHELCSCRPVADDGTTVALGTGVDRTVPFATGSVAGETRVQGRPLSAFPGPDGSDLHYRFGTEAYTTITLESDTFETYHTYPEYDLALRTRTTFDTPDRATARSGTAVRSPSDD